MLRGGTFNAVCSGMRRTLIPHGTAQALVLATTILVVCVDQSVARADQTTAELRIELFRPAFGWTSGSEGQGARQLYVVPAFGVRVFPTQLNHGALVDFEWIDFGLSTFGNNLAVAHLGYAYRFLVHPEGRARLLLTPHASLSTGAQTVFPNPDDKSFVVGVDLGKTLPFEKTQTAAREAARLLVEAAPLPSPSSIAPSPAITPKDSERVRRGRILLSSGVPLMVVGAAGLAWGITAECHQPNDNLEAVTALGGVTGGIGFGLTTGGLVSLLRASKAARKAPEPSAQRRRRILAASLTSVASVLVVGLVGVGEWGSCINS